MKKLILLLTLIPLVGASQTFDEISSINNTDGFSRVMIENGFQRYSKDSLFVSYIFNPQGEGLNVKAERMGHWDIENKEFSKTREEILEMIWNMEEEIMGREE